MTKPKVSLRLNDKAGQGVTFTGKRLVCMETLEIKVTTKQQARRIVRELEQRPDVASVRVVTGKSPRSEQKAPKPGVDEVTLASEMSLAKDWLSPADDHWDNVYKDLCTKKAI